MPRILGCLYLFSSLVTFFAFWRDKLAAQNGRWRTRESTLHLLSLVGGWPGALIARKVFHHKTIKRSFGAVLWLAIFVNTSTVFLLWRASMLWTD